MTSLIPLSHAVERWFACGGKTVSTLRLAIKRGELKAVKLGGGEENGLLDTQGAQWLLGRQDISRCERINMPRVLTDQERRTAEALWWMEQVERAIRNSVHGKARAENPQRRNPALAQGKPVGSGAKRNASSRQLTKGKSARKKGSRSTPAGGKKARI